MKELLGRFTHLDPDALEALKVISYFDALLDGHVGVSGLLRAAAALSGTAAGYRDSFSGEARRATADGDLQRSGSPDGWPRRALPDGGNVWIERTGDAHANDAMVLERLALTLTAARVDSREPTRRALEVLLDDASTPTDVRRAADTLGVANATIRIVASLAQTRLPQSLSQTILTTPWGFVTAHLLPHSARVDQVRAGVGHAVASSEARDSWRNALITLRLTTPDDPLLHADELGSLLLVATAADALPAPHPDALIVETIAANPADLRILIGLAHSDSMRAIADRAHLHHSSVQGRVARLRARLGFDPRTPLGRARLGVALALYRLHTFE